MNQICLFFVGLLSFSGAAFAAGPMGLSGDESQSILEQGALLVDVRTPEEWKVTGLIPGSYPLTFFDSTGHYDKDAWLKSLKPLLKKPRQPIVLVCRSGNRSATVGKFLVNEAGFDKVYHLEKGIKEWFAEGRPLSPPCASVLACAPTRQGTGKATP